MSVVAAIAPLPWDSAFFGFPVARVLAERPDAAALDAAIAACEGQRIRCAYLLLEAGDHHASELAQERGFILRDVRVELDRRVDPAGVPNASLTAADDGASVQVAEALPEQRDALLQLARSRFTGSRFFADPNFPRERCAELYAQFVRRGLSDAPARFTLATADASGFIICHVDTGNRTGAIELIAVSDAAAGRGIGVALVDAAHRRFARAGLEHATVVTQGANVAAQRIYQRTGFRTARTGLWFHRWFD